MNEFEHIANLINQGLPFILYAQRSVGVIGDLQPFTDEKAIEDLWTDLSDAYNKLYLAKDKADGLAKQYNITPVMQYIPKETESE